jgi:hypothetical protein
MQATTVRFTPRPGDANPATEWRTEVRTNLQAARADLITRGREDVPQWVHELVGLLVIAIAGALAALVIVHF